MVGDVRAEPGSDPELTASPVTPEREVPVAEALDHVVRLLADLRLDVDEVVLGDPALPVTIYTARDESGAIVARSAGKGRGAQSRASGMFELVEHYHLDWRVRPYPPGEPAFRAAAEVASQPTLARANLVQRLGAGIGEEPLLCARYEEIDPAADPDVLPARATTTARRRAGVVPGLHA